MLTVLFHVMFRWLRLGRKLCSQSEVLCRSLWNLYSIEDMHKYYRLMKVIESYEEYIIEGYVAFFV